MIRPPTVFLNLDLQVSHHFLIKPRLLFLVNAKFASTHAIDKLTYLGD